MSNRVSGHATIGAATFKILEDFYHTDAIPGGLTIISDEFNTITVDQNSPLSAKLSTVSEADEGVPEAGGTEHAG